MSSRWIAQGFILTHQNSAVKNFYDDGEVRSVYYPEVERLVKEATGAARVLVFDHNVRRGTSAGPAEKGVREPVKYAHNDYTVKSGPQRVRDLLPADEAEALLKNRFAVINVWRPIRGPVEETPLAVCDARSIAPQDLVPTDLRYPDRTGEVYSLAFNPAHRWFYFPRMRADEVMLLKCYDSARRRPRALHRSRRVRRSNHASRCAPRARVSKSARWCSSRRRLAAQDRRADEPKKGPFQQ